MSICMLSNIEAVLLSIINEKPSYAYEIDKTIEQRDMRMWLRIGVASIYQVLKRLEEKNYVYSKREREGKMPDRKRYYITDSGRAALVETSKKLLSTQEWYYLDLNVGIETADLLTYEEITDCLTKRLAKVKSKIEILKEDYLTEKGITFKKKAIVNCLIYFREAEVNFLQDAIKQLSINICK